MPVAERVGSVPRTANADPADRVVVATAEIHGAALVSSDSKFPGMTSTAVIW